MSIKTRVKQLERATGQGDKQLLVLYQNEDDPDLFGNIAGQYRRGAEDWPDPDVYDLMLVTYNRSNQNDDK